jgi:hypothetical protein
MRYTVEAARRDPLIGERAGSHLDKLLPPLSAPTLRSLPSTAGGQASNPRVHESDEIMREILAKRLVEHLERAGFVVRKRAQGQVT